MKRTSVAVALVLLFSSPASAQSPSEWVLQGALPDLVVAYEQRGGGSTIVERIPPGETVDRWTRMATNQRFAGLVARGVTLDDWLRDFAGRIAGACPGANATDVREFTLAGRPAIELRADCPLNPATGLPETFFLRAIAGRADLHVAQVAFRRLPSDEDLSYARAHLSTVEYCQSSDASAACMAAVTAPEAR